MLWGLREDTGQHKTRSPRGQRALCPLPGARRQLLQAPRRQPGLGGVLRGMQCIPFIGGFLSLRRAFSAPSSWKLPLPGLKLSPPSRAALRSLISPSILPRALRCFPFPLLRLPLNPSFSHRPDYRGQLLSRLWASTANSVHPQHKHQTSLAPSLNLAFHHPP